MPHHYALSSYHGRAQVARMKGVIMRKNEASWVEQEIYVRQSIIENLQKLWKILRFAFSQV